MKKGILFLLLMLGSTSVFADNSGQGLGGPPLPIDTDAIILIVVAVLLSVGVVTYKKLNFKKA